VRNTLAYFEEEQLDWKRFMRLVPGRCEAANLLREEIINKRKVDETLK
jgi:hypothetical protein